jgi:hypothetical protein
MEWGWRAVASRPAVGDPWLLIPDETSRYKRPFQPGFGCPIQQGHLQLADAALLRGRAPK